uniref:BZIP domain-containing protein n=1 Tax=Kalanchoe fedtschenkoi TaxID=63787 RepID=A0A7N0RIF1_KALFE
MGIQMMGLQGGDQQSHRQQPARQNSWYNLTFDELNKRFRALGKPVGDMSLKELLNHIRLAESHHARDATGEGNSSSATSMQHQAGLTMARALRGKTVDEIWRDVQLGQKKILGQEIKIENEATFGELTLEDFLVKAGMFVEANFGQGTELDLFDGPATQNFGSQMELSRSPSIDTMSDTPTPGSKRGAVDQLDRSVERRIRRKIKNRESAARSRARKQAYYNELVTRVSVLEEKNLRLKRDKQLDSMLPYDPHKEKKYQLRRTSSASF